MHTQNPESLLPMTAKRALELLREGNDRFVAGRHADRDPRRQVNETRGGQWPFAAILRCRDSRTSAELVFDLGLGDAFSIRFAATAPIKTFSVVCSALVRSWVRSSFSYTLPAAQLHVRRVQPQHGVSHPHA